MSGPPARCAVCRAPANTPCVGPDGRALPGVHTERIKAGVRELFGSFAPPVPKVNGPMGGKA